MTSLLDVSPMMIAVSCARGRPVVAFRRSTGSPPPNLVLLHTAPLLFFSRHSSQQSTQQLENQACSFLYLMARSSAVLTRISRLITCQRAGVCLCLMCRPWQTLRGQYTMCVAHRCMCEVGETKHDLLVTLGQAFVDQMVDDESERTKTRNTKTLQNQSPRTPWIR